MRYLYNLGVIIYLLIHLINVANAVNINASKENPTLLTAKNLIFDHEQKIITAEGNVIISHNGHILHADRITYRIYSDLITAFGKVRLEEPSKEIIFVDQASLTGNLREGFLHTIRMLLSDNSRLTATKALRQNSTHTEFERVVFSPCHVCKKDPTTPLLWQIKSRHVLWDSKKHDIEYTDAFFEFYGIPVLYLPYFSHPDPSVKKRTGYLLPTFGAKNNTDALVSIPYYFNIATDKDLTLTPILATKVQALYGQYRQIFSSGEIDFKTSVAHTNKEPLGKSIKNSAGRWHADIKARHNLNPNWRTGIDVERASDQTYVRRFPQFNLSSKAVLTSRMFVEGFRGRNYSNFQVLSFQGLRSGDKPNNIPVVLPMIDYNYISKPYKGGSHFNLDANILALARKKGNNVRRLSVLGGWNLPFTSSYGDIYSLTATLRGTAYHVENFVPEESSGEKLSGLTGYIFPQLALNWRYPWIARLSQFQTLVEPIISIIAAPNKSRNTKMPNEDSRIVEFNDVNIFSLDRYPGLDRLDTGSRVDWGINLNLYGISFIPATFFFGQSYNLSEPRSIFEGTGLDKRWSDYVTRVEILPSNWLKLHYRARLDRAHLTARRSELSMLFGQPTFNIKLDYIFISKISKQLGEKTGKQATVTLSSQFTKYWSANASLTKEFGEGAGTLSEHLSLAYLDECLSFKTKITKTFYKDRDIRPGTSILFTIGFKQLEEDPQGHDLTEKRTKLVMPYKVTAASQSL